MQPINFPEANVNLGKPANMTDAECSSLPVYTDGRTCVSLWQFTDEQLRQLINNDGKLWVGVLSGTTQPPIFLDVNCPIGYSPIEPLTPEYEKALRFIAGLLPLPETASDGLVDGADMKAYDLPHLKGEEIEEGKQYLITSEQAIEQHYAALVDAFCKKGRAGVIEYLLPYEGFLPKEVITQS